MREDGSAAGVRLLLPEPVELGLGEPAFQEGARVDAWRGVPLEEDLVAGLARSLPRKKWLNPTSYREAAEA